MRADVLVVRSAAPADADALADLHHRAMRAAYAGFVTAQDLDAVTLEGLREGWRERLSGPHGDTRTLVADDGGAVVGFVRVGASRDPDARAGDGELHALYVEPARLGTGLGHALLVAGEAELADRYAGATLWVLEPNGRAWRFYERHGWSVDDAPFDPGRWGWAPSVRLRKALSP